MRPGSCFSRTPHQAVDQGFYHSAPISPTRLAFDPGRERRSSQGLSRIGWPASRQARYWTLQGSSFDPNASLGACLPVVASSGKMFLMCMESEPPDDCDLAERQYSDRLRSHEKFCVTSLLGDTPSPITSGLMPSVVKAIVAAFFMRWPTYTPDGAFYTRRIPPWWFLTRQRHGVMRSWHMRGFAREIE